ncbi:MAG: hypothetical protein EOO08_10060 [Chitinophagaceae bacterium]|nr:MAG: hypothetical protein EOO08_10060 [Chitinophagaceae bacterium]
MQQLTEQLDAAAAGLLVISESEAPLLVCTLEGREETESALRRLCGQPDDAPVEIQDALAFLQKQENIYAGQPEAGRFRQLSALLSTHLPDMQLYRVGSIRIDAFLLATLPDGTRIGLRTVLVET